MRNEIRRVVRWIKSFFSLSKGQQGQALILFVFGFVGILALVGLAVDSALIYVHYDHLRRSVDAAAVSAVNQYREGRDAQELNDAAEQALRLQLPGVQNVQFRWCSDVSDPAHDPNLCSDPPRKRVRIEAELPVDLTFIKLVWDDQVILHAYAEAEAAVLNMVLLIDTSESMAYTSCPPSMSELDFFNCLEDCRTLGTCEPFESVRSAALGFVSTLMREDVDRVAIYHFDKTPVLSGSVESFTCWTPGTRTVSVTLTESSGVVMPLTMTRPSVTSAITQGQGVYADPLNVYIRPEAYDPGTGERCDVPTHVGGDRGDDGGTMRWGYGYRWASTNIGGGLYEAVTELVRNGSTDAAIWVVVLLSDGAANATDQATDGNDWWTCPSPPSERPLNPDYRDHSVTPFCRDPECQLGDTPAQCTARPPTRHCPSFASCNNTALCDDPTNPSTCWYTNWGETITKTIMWNYDADDYARDMADLASSQQIAIYTIGFGPKVTGALMGRPDAGERLLRYIADVGDDGNLETAPCGSDYYWDDIVDPMPPLGSQCGNYYHAPGAAELVDVFEDIASRIFSRITQ